MRTIFQVWELKNAELLVGGERNLVAEIDGTNRARLRGCAYGGFSPPHMGELQKRSAGYI